MKSTKHPLSKQIAYIEPHLLANVLQNQSNLIWLDSANHQQAQDLNRYSFIAVDPWRVFRWKLGDEGDPLNELQQQLAPLKLATVPELPPFQGGIAGYFGYDLCHYLDDIPLPQQDDMQFDDIIVGYYDLVMSFDHHAKKAWIISTGWPADNEQERLERAATRLGWLEQLISSPTESEIIEDFTSAKIRSNFTKEAYLKMVQSSIDYINAGDIFEVNVSQRFSAEMPPELSTFQLYSRLRKINPAPFAAYLNFDDTVIASASPERFLQCQHNIVETRPIKGTRPRDSNAQQDQLLADELLNSEKDRAENIMIVDLMRNDLSRVCLDDSVKVLQLCGLESFATVHHLVSVVKGCLTPNHDVIDLIRATFPGGSITGAPKIRVMQVIAELEPTRRGPYCGSVGYIGHDDSLDLSIIIRTFAIKNNQITFQAGGAIVYDSDPEQEYEETLTKAQALIRTLNAEKVLA